MIAKTSSNEAATATAGLTRNGSAIAIAGSRSKDAKNAKDATIALIQLALIANAPEEA